jgi:SAM-dependent methyltransferase
MFNHTAVNECITFLNDIPRNTWYRDNLQKIVPDKIVMEIGCGAGLLAAYALEAGAKKYYGIDIRSNRVDFTKKMLNELGYGDRAIVWTDDFCQLTTGDIPGNIDILLCEQTGHQFQNNIAMLQFWKHANKIFPKNYLSIPNEWSIDVAVYAGLVSDYSELCPRTFIHDSSLPTGYSNFVKKTQIITPALKHDALLKFTPTTCNKNLEFLLDLKDYPSATVVISDSISYCGQRCNSISATTDWPGPIKILIPNAGAMIKFYWDNTLRCLPNYTKGFWTYEYV